MIRFLKKGRLGFTLIELLVVIAIIAILVGLLVPAVQKVRAAAARTQSLNNIKQMALGTHGYHDGKRYMPPTELYQYNDSGTIHQPFFVAILPYIEQDAIYKSFFWGTSYFDPTYSSNYNKAIPVYMNPSDPSSSDGTANGYGTVGYGVNNAALPAITIYNWGWSNKYTSAPGKKTLGSGYPDGTAATVLLAEKYSVFYGGWGGNYWYNSSPTFQVYQWGNSGPAWYGASIELQPLPASAQPSNVQAPRSEGILIGMADGSGRLLPGTTDNTTWWAICTPNGGEIPGDF